MSAPSSVLVVGASVGGLAVAEALRREGYAGGLTLLGAEPHLPYDRPPLSKQVLSGAWEPARTQLRPDSALAQLGAELILGDPAVSLDLGAREVGTASGRKLRAEVIVLATGLEPRRLPGQEQWAGVHVLRTLDEALALRAYLLAGPRVVSWVMACSVRRSPRPRGAWASRSRWWGRNRRRLRASSGPW